MKEQSTLEARVREVLRAEAAAADTPVIETAAGLVRVTVDGRDVRRNEYGMNVGQWKSEIVERIGLVAQAA